MAYLNRHWMSRIPPAARLYTVVLAVVFPVCLLVAISPTLRAAPLTLRFKATVDGVLGSAVGILPPSWPFSLEQGDVIQGAFTFQPYDAAPSVLRTTVDEPFPFVMQIKSQTLTASRYGIEVYNDTRVHEEPPIPLDTISMGRSFFAADETQSNSGTPIGYAFQVGLIGESTVLDGADIPTNPMTWQQFNYAHFLYVYLLDPINPGVYGFEATVDSFQTVPEPTAWHLAAYGAGVLFIVRGIGHKHCSIRRWR